MSEPARIAGVFEPAFPRGRIAVIWYANRPCLWRLKGVAKPSKNEKLRNHFVSKSQSERPIDRELRCPSDGVFQGHSAIRTIVGLARTADRIKHLFARLLRDHDLTLSQYEVLRVLRDMNCKLSVVELAGFMVHPTPAMTGLLDRLERDSLIERERTSDDRRLVHVKLLRKGKAVVKRLDEPVVELHKQFVAGLSSGEQSKLEELLLKLRDALPD